MTEHSPMPDPTPAFHHSPPPTDFGHQHHLVPPPFTSPVQPENRSDPMYGLPPAYPQSFGQMPPPGGAFGPPPRKRGVPIWAVIVIVIVVLACVSGAVALAVVTTSSSTTASPSPIVEPVPLPTRSPAKTSGLSTGDKIGAWYNGGGAKRLNAISADLSAEAKAAQAVNLGKTRKACEALRSDVAAARAYGPIPAAAVQKPWAAALTHFNTASIDCVNAINHHNGSLLSRSASELKAGDADVQKTVAALQKYS